MKGSSVSGLDILAAQGNTTASRMLTPYQVPGEESLFPTILMETTIMKSDPPNFFKWLMVDYLQALVRYMLPGMLYCPNY